MRNRIRQRGDGKLGCVIWGLIFAIVVMAGYKMIPVKVKAAELEDFMIEQCRFADFVEPKDLKEGILARSRELELPLDKKNLTVKKQGGRIKMEARYTVPVEFPGYTYEWTFVHNIDRPIFAF